jgi:hypothetical protein
LWRLIGSFYSFVPNNAAFNASAAALGGLPPNELEAYLQHHVYNGLLFSSALTAGSSATVVAADGTELVLAKTAAGAVTVDGARVVQADVLTKNGVIHVIDRVLSPGQVPDPSAVTTGARPTATGTATAAPQTTSRPSSAGPLKPALGFVAAVLLSLVVV